MLRQSFWKTFSQLKRMPKNLFLTLRTSLMTKTMRESLNTRWPRWMTRKKSRDFKWKILFCSIRSIMTQLIIKTTALKLQSCSQTKKEQSSPLYNRRGDLSTRRKSSRTAIPSFKQELTNSNWIKTSNKPPFSHSKIKLPKWKRMRHLRIDISSN